MRCVQLTRMARDALPSAQKTAGNFLVSHGSRRRAPGPSRGTDRHPNVGGVFRYHQTEPRDRLWLEVKIVSIIEMYR